MKPGTKAGFHFGGRSCLAGLKKRSVNKLIPINSTADILPVYRTTPVGRLLEYHNLELPFVNIQIAPLYYLVDNNKLYLIKED